MTRAILRDNVFSLLQDANESQLRPIGTSVAFNQLLMRLISNF